MDDKELQALVEHLSMEYFHKPFKHRAYFNPRLRTTGGRYLLKSHHIEINRKYYEQLGKEELIGIIKHELCHYHLHLAGKGYKHRDKDFKKLLEEVNAPRFCSDFPQRPSRKITRKKYIYQCTKCELIYERKRTVNLEKYVCGKCQGKLIKIHS